MTVRVVETHPAWNARIGQWYDMAIGPATKATAAEFRQRANFLGQAASSEADFKDYLARRGAALQHLLRVSLEAKRRRP